eukprot:14332228-Heterocapsa_arctica.AAC.1
MDVGRRDERSRYRVKNSAKEDGPRKGEGGDDGNAVHVVQHGAARPAAPGKGTSTTTAFEGATVGVAGSLRE